MSFSPDIMAELMQSVEALYDGELTPEQAQRLESLLAEDPAARSQYVQLTAFFVSLQSCCATLPEDDNDECGMPHSERGLGASVPSGETNAFPIPELSVPHSPFIFSPSPAVHFCGGAVFSYLMAALIVGVGLLVAWAWKLPDHAQVAGPAASSPSSLAPSPSPKMTFVGRITGMVDCQWADPDTAAFNGASIPLGRKYALSSGLMQITYDSGAKVILQGPCTYEVESPTGGYLAVGKVTARMDKKATSLPSPSGRGAGGEGSEKNGDRDESQTALTLTLSQGERGPGSNSSFLIPHSYFAIRTPTAVVTDLGTEFGVEVSQNGSSEVHVLTGEVDLMTQHDQRHLRLRANAAGDNVPTAARVEAGTAENGEPQIVLVTPAPGRFLRALPGASVGTRGERIVVASRFNVSDEGWTASSPSSAGLVYARDGGNPGGCIQTQEGTGPDFFYWIAPAKFTGNGASLFGGQLRFDVYTTIFQSTPGVAETMAMEPPMVILQGRTDRIAADQQVPAKRDQWTSMSVPLSAAGKWYRPEGSGVLEGKPTDRTPVSEEVIREVLADLRSIWIRAEYMHGRDLGRLDNVFLLAPANTGRKAQDPDQSENKKGNP